MVKVAEGQKGYMIDFYLKLLEYVDNQDYYSSMLNEEGDDNETSDVRI